MTGASGRESPVFATMGDFGGDWSGDLGGDLVALTAVGALGGELVILDQFSICDA